ncbi:MAG: sn-glycerol-3-phosphate ABC transporter ATP-binding protein UgpC, partial [Candidatus Izemoplasmatales bacterium]|nr:sn-glycerol-3-phosphate ABC transporter ATP-binding protein UgpC [Candidatus Izemoplasmatales bacterium]
MSTLSFKGLNKIYDNGVQAVFDFNLEVKDKEFIVFVGPSGCGKSTTLRMVAGLEEISSGELYIDDRMVNDVAPKDRDIAMVFQSYALYPHMSVYDNMAFGLKLRKTPKVEIEKRVQNAADILGLVSYLDRKPKALSGGQRQRVALGRAIVRDAKVFLMDEPLSNLDAKLRVAMRAELIKLHERLETTTIYVTHDQIEAMTMATRIVVMKDGRIQQIGAPKDIYDNPNNMFVGGFIGTPAMNFLPGKVDENGYFTCETFKVKIDKKHMDLL